MQPSPPPAAGGTLTLFTSYPKLAFMLALFSPALTINGHVMRVQWGQTTVPLPPGTHDIRVHVPYLWDVGKAQLVVDNRDGAPVAVYYAAPYIAFSNGAIDRQPVEPPDKTLGLILFVGPLVLLVLMFLACCGLSGLSMLDTSTT